MKETRRAVIYARYSSNNQREESIDAQLRICRRFADEHGLSVIAEYTDSAISGRTDQRPGFQQMIKDSSKGHFEVLLIYAHDRFSRDKYDTATYKARLKKNGVRVISATLPLDESPEAGLMESIMEGFAQYYSENLSRSTKRGQEENALHCKSNGSPALGYKVENGFFVLDPVRANAVRIIFEMYTEGYGKQQICDRLNEEGYTTRTGKSFKINGLHTILSNERYTGVYIYDGIRHENGLPAIISKEMFERAQIQIESRKRSRGRTKAMEEYLLSGKVFCGDCGKPMVGESGTSSTGETYHYYKCSARKKRLAPCSKKTERKDELEDLVVAYICHEVLTDEMIEKIAAKQFELLEAESADKSLLKSMESEYKDVSQKVNNLLEAIEDGLYTRTTKSRLTELEDRQAELEDKIIREKLKKPEFTKEHIIFWLNKFRAGDINDFEYKRAVINSLVNSVYVYDESDDDDDGGDGKKVVVALTLKNVPVRTLTRSDVQKMGRLTRFERAHHGATIRCVNHFTTTAICNAQIS